ncbi:Hypothetical predicted protein [Podarcis lilfordi]|uniref:Uncharacterized protein n=1 Tax=Podarcis lilfordi TaxID=74358 RepID=A0AA35KC20_9SAUR|nr:Hypothetical predicted protein [Podarcis lilfordi]
MKLLNTFRNEICKSLQIPALRIISLRTKKSDCYGHKPERCVYSMFLLSACNQEVPLVHISNVATASSRTRGGVNPHFPNMFLLLFPKAENCLQVIGKRQFFHVKKDTLKARRRMS